MYDCSSVPKEDRLLQQFPVIRQKNDYNSAPKKDRNYYSSAPKEDRILEHFREYDRKITTALSERRQRNYYICEPKDYYSSPENLIGTN